MKNEISALTAVELRDAYAGRALSPVEAAKSALARIDALNARFGAYCFVDHEQALADARASETRWMRNEPLSAIDGVTASIKDLCLAKGWPTLRGSATIDPAGPWTEDSPCTARLKDAGAVLLGKTTTPERGWKGVTDNPLGHVARNPWDPSRTAGGSSGGAAVAAALGMGALHIGTDGGGSIRIPASFSGIFGLKPTFARVPAYPASAFGDVSHTGPMTRCVTDAALMLDIIAEPDARDWQSLPKELESFATGIDKGIAGCRIGWSADLGFAIVDPEIAGIVHSAAQSFSKLGATIDDARLRIKDPIDIFHKLWFTGAAAVVQSVPTHQHGKMDPGLLDIAAQGRSLSHMDHVAATLARAEFARMLSCWFDKFDLLLTPMMPISAFEAGRETPAESGMRRWTEWTGLTYPFNLSQQPAASIPCGFTKAGLPVGLQIVGRRHADRLVLKAARAFERLCPIALPAM
jgi:aspartyl-tRNA(Asn)/glutamyl-tRNA(Gln) amidotransferase subunit A